MISYYQVEDLGIIGVKRTHTKRIRITFGIVGEPIIRIPQRAKLQTALNYLISHKTWVINNRPLKKVIKENAYVLDYQILRGNMLTSNIRTSHINKTITMHSDDSSFYHPQNQLNLHKKASQILKKKAKTILDSRISTLANTHNLSYSSLRISSTTSRWGSCSSENKIMLSSYLIQLPNVLQEYIMLHELTHTIEHNHSNNFWLTLEKLCPDYKQRRLALKKYHPGIITSSRPIAVQ